MAFQNHFFAIISIACSLRAGASETIITLDVLNKEKIFLFLELFNVMIVSVSKIGKIIKEAGLFLAPSNQRKANTTKHIRAKQPREGTSSRKF